MRLLQIDSYDTPSLTDELVDNIPPYAILSHTWKADHEEVTFEALHHESSRSKAGYTKIQFCGQQARNDNLAFFWVDTCCINKAKCAELSEALNSMFSWYRKAEKCYVYLSDVSARKRENDVSTERTWEPAFRKSRWFTRGWTLQELLAPASVEFFSSEGHFLGSKETLAELIQDITGIPLLALRGAPVADFSIDERMRWAAKRDTKRMEDKIYCLLGIFEVFMVPIYGEGEHAWARLKDEIGKSYRNQLDGIGQRFLTSNLDAVSGATADPRRELLDSLSFDQMDSRQATIKNAYSTTCKWLLAHPAYTSWTDPNELHEHKGFFWINGKPGAGKSTLVKFIHAATTKAKSEDEIVISFFFNARGDELERSTVGMYRSLLFQILKRAPDLQDICLDFCSSLRYRSRSYSWTIEPLCDALSHTIAHLGRRRLKCFIDALDECDEQQVRDMIVFFEALGQRAIDDRREVHTCFTSRHYPTIDIRSGCQLVLENEGGHSEDLAKYVQSHLRAGSGKYIEEIRSSIQQKANGVFMWAVLVVDILNEEFRKGRIFAVRKRLEEIPAKLSDLFKDILRRDYANMEDLLLCLQWILFAKRPLRREEFYFALVAGLDPEPENLTEWNCETVTQENMSKFVLNSSKGLAEVTKSKSPTVQFIHESVRDFLIKDHGLCELWPSLGKDLQSTSHERLKQCCQSYLTANAASCTTGADPLPKASSDAAKEIRQRLSAKFPFLDYASRYVLHHADEAAGEISQDCFLRNFDLETLLKVINHLEPKEIRRHTSSASLVYLLAEYGFARLIHTARRCGFALNDRGERYHFPLFAAIANKRSEAIGALLQQKGSISVEDIITPEEAAKQVSRVDKGHTPLLWALNRGHLKLAELLVTSDLWLLDSQDMHAPTVAAGRGYERLVTLMLTVESINVNLPDERQRTVLHYCAEHGFTTLVQLLIERGAQIDASDHGGLTALMCACVGSNEAVVRILIEKGADLEAKDKTGNTALIWAARKASRLVVQLLIDEGADLEAKDHTGCTILLWAAREGSECVAELLIERGADTEAKDDYRCTPLIWAASKGAEAMLHLLITQGADIEARDVNGRTGLLWAARNGQARGIKLLIERGAGIEAKNIDYRTSLSFASENADKLSIRILLASGAKPDTKDRMGRTALHWAIEGDEQRAPFQPKFGVDYGLEEFHTQLMLLEAQNARRRLMAGVEQDQASQVSMEPEKPDRWRPVSDMRFEIIQALLAHGAQPDAASNNGTTPFNVAIERGWDNVVQLFREQCASVSHVKPG